MANTIVNTTIDTPTEEILKPIHSLPLEEVIRLPGTASVSQMGLAKEEDILPAVAFKERRAIRTITGLEDIQNHQRAGKRDFISEMDPFCIKQNVCSNNLGIYILLLRSY